MNKKIIYQSNNFGPVEILERKGKNCKIKFLNTGSIRTALLDNVKVGKVRDLSCENPNKKDWEDCSIEFTNNSGHRGKIIRKKSKKCVVLFYNTGFITEAYLDNVMAGKIKDPYEKTYLSTGWLGEFKKVSYWKKAKLLWSNMMKRCYDPNYKGGYFHKGVTVDERWKCFANFLDDLPKIENFDKWVEYSGKGVKYNLDKDTIFIGNKVYSKSSCKFITESDNKSEPSKRMKLGKSGGSCLTKC